MTKYSATEKMKINDKINEWSKKHPYGQRVAKNIFSEHFLPEEKMNEILSFIANDASTSWKEFEVDYQKVCYTLALQGGNIKVKQRPQLFGAAVEYETFFKHLQDNYPTTFIDDTSTKDFISNLANGTLPDLRKVIRLKRFGVWATWNLQNLSGMPFDYCNTKIADEVRANMGLRRTDAKTALLLFVYTIPNHIEPKRPTIADAELSQYFEPPVPTFEEHGWTRTWEFEERMSKFNLDPKPECIHDSIQLSELKLPIEIRP